MLSLITLSTSLVAADWNGFKQDKLQYLSQIPGWCSPEKAQKMMDLILEVRPKICVEIGVFGGSSIYPTACALSFTNGGIVYAIDPWSTEECLKGYTPGDPNYNWWGMIDQEKIYQDFLNMLRHFRVANYCKAMRSNAAMALSTFADNSIDILHVDGNHTEDSAFKDVTMYLPKVKKGGYIWFDDANWSSTNKAVMFLMENCQFLPDRSVGNACLLFYKP